jgi:hypothetical protein
MFDIDVQKMQEQKQVFIDFAEEPQNSEDEETKKQSEEEAAPIPDLVFMV